MKNNKFILGFVVFVLVAFGAFAVAKADDDKDSGKNFGLKLGMMMKEKWYGEEKEMINKKGSTLEVHINDNGTVLVRGAKVTAVSGSTITAVTAWNGASLTWTVNTNANTKFIELKNGQSSVADIKVNDFVSFSGNLMAGSTFTVEANQVKNWSVMPKVKTTVEGKIDSIAGTVAPTTFTLKRSDNTVYTVKVGTTTSVLGNNWLTVPLTSFQVGNQVRVYGVINADNSIDATVVRNVSL